MRMDPVGLRERDAELRALTDALDATATGRGGLVVIDGPAGAGVTSLVRAAVEGARERGMAVGEARAAAGAQDGSFGVARQLFAAAWTQLSAARAADDPELVQALAGQARRVAELGPGLLLAVDDAHRADAASLRVLLALAPWLADLPVLVVVGRHPTAAGTDTALLAGLLDQPRARVLTPAALSASALAELAAQRLGDDPSTPFVALWAQLSAGSPWLATVILQALDDRALPPTPGSLRGLVDAPPPPLRRRVERTLGELSPAAARLAAALAVLAEPTSLADAAALAELAADAAGAAADELAALRLVTAVEPLRFREPLVGATVAAALPPFARAGLHRAALALLTRSGAEPARRGTHLLHLPPAGDPATVATLREAATTAAGADDRAAAVALLRRALAEPPPQALHTAVLTELALAELAARSDLAVDRLTEALRRPDLGTDRPRIQVALSRALLARGDYSQASVVAAEADAALGPSDPAAEPLLVVQLIASSVVGDLAPATMAHLQRAIGSALSGEIPEDPGLCAWMAAFLSSQSAPLPMVRALIDRALRDSPLVDDSHQSIQSFARAALLNVDDVVRAEQSSTEAMAYARARDLPIAYGLAQHGRALARYGAGRIEEALVDAEATMPLRHQGWTVHIGYNAALLVAIHLDRGEHDAAKVALQLGHEVTVPGTLDAAYVLHAQALLELALDDPVAALESALAAHGALVEFGVAELSPACLRWAPTAAIAAAASGDRERGRALATHEVDRARATGLPGTIGIALRAAGHCAVGQERVALLREAVAQLERSPLRLELARALIDLGAAIRAPGDDDLGDRLAAREPLAAGLDLADRCGATVLVARAREELRRAGAKPRRAALTGVAALTASERRVAELAARGDTNPQIAETLFVSVKTVEGTLARAYRKLEIGSRGELPGALGAATDPG